MKKTLILCAAALSLGVAAPVMARDYSDRDCEARRSNIERQINQARRHQSQYQVDALRAQLRDVNRLCRGDRMRGDESWRHVNERDNFRHSYRRDRDESWRQDRNDNWRNREVERSIDRAIDNWLR